MVLVHFCYASVCINHRYTCVPSLLKLSPTSHPLPPLQVITEPQFEFPESPYSKFPVAIYLHMLVYMLPCYSLHSSHPLPLGLCSHLPPFPPSRLSQSTRLSSLSYIAASYQSSVLRVVVYMFQFSSLSLSHPLLPVLCVFFMSASLSCSANRFISIVFLDSIYIQDICSSLSDLLHSV